jgi:hypothetical protein
MPTLRRLSFLSVLMYVLTAAGGTVAAGVYALNSALISSECAVNCASFSEYEREDPVCIVDPSCVSLLYRYDGSGERRWMGTHWWSLAEEQEAPPSWQALAPLNYLFFLLLTVSLAVAASRRLAGHGQRLVLTALTAWSATAVCAWIVAAAEQPSRGIVVAPYSAALLAEGALLMIVTIAVPWLAVRSMPRRSEATPSFSS